ncbi:MAG: beta-ketoacyl-[acyl-carrier-protein] synthase family protein [Planctomycetes bacterium]|nr:beta-ketoacyl-[acyl-carrier-protein] synthase family protein [Planctomycetota bacterium]
MASAILRTASRRVVVTGLGVVSPIGLTRGAYWQALVEGRSGVRGRSAADGSPAAIPCAAEASEFTGDIENFGPLEPAVKKAIRKALKLMNRDTLLAVAAGQQALAESGVLAVTGGERVGVCFGADNISMNPDDFLGGVRACTGEDGRFDFDRWGTEGLGEIEPLWLLKCLPNMPACYLAIFNGLMGPNNTITEGAVSANLAIAEACRLIEDGLADAVLTGATGTTLRPFNLMHALGDEEFIRDCRDPQTASRPFDLHRRGAVPAEGAAAFVLEDLHAALERGATIYGEIAAASAACAIDASGRADGRRSLARSMRECLERAGLEPRSVGHLHAHGLSTQRMDADEAGAIRDVFAAEAERVPLVAAKSHQGHASAGSGATEMAASLLALRKGRLFPVLNYEQPDRACPVRPVTVAATVPAGDSFLNLNLTPHGQASCVAVRAWESN